MSPTWRDQYMCDVHRPPDERLRGAAPCPFCGSDRLSLSRMGNFVQCDGCGADGPEVRTFRKYGPDTWRVALEQWNARWIFPAV